MPNLRISRILSKHAQECGGNAELRRRIGQANPGRKLIDTRKLGDIIKGAPVTLGMSDLEAIDTYLRPFGQGLADHPLFDDDCILRDIARMGKITFLVPTRIVDYRAYERDYTSVWDMRAFSAIAENLKYRWPMTQITLQEEVSRDFAPAPQDRDWEQLLGGKETSYCCLGSPLATLTSEYMMASMFGVQPFKSPSALDQPLPFYFVWYPPPENATSVQRIPIRFAFNADDLEKAEGYEFQQDLPQAIRERRAQALVVGNRVYEVRLDQPEHNDYAVIVAQRRKHGVIWCVIAGLSGPGTFKAAEQTVKTSEDSKEAIVVRECGPEEVSKPVFAVVESLVTEDPTKEYGDRRSVTGGEARIVLGPTEWSSGTGWA